MESMVDHILGGRTAFAWMTAIKDYDEYTYHHSVNRQHTVSSFRTEARLSRKMLTDLGMVALFHDTGKTEVPSEVLNKPTNFTEDEWKVIKKHPMWGLRAILKLKKLDELTMKSAIVSFEHHMNFDHSGYPKTRQIMELDLFSRIVSLADQYDAMTSARVYSRTPLAPDKALSIMMERSGSQLDPLLFKFFINMVEFILSVRWLCLDSKETGTCHRKQSAVPARPRVFLIMNSQGKRIQGHIADLTGKRRAGIIISDLY